MTTIPMFPGFDGLMLLSRREGVDIRPTLLRVLTDLYVQTPSHTLDEERQFVALTSRLIDEVDDATRAAVRARLSIYPHTPRPIADKLALRVPGGRAIARDRQTPVADSASKAAADTDGPGVTGTLSMQPDEASELNRLFFAADAGERLQILQNIERAPLKTAARIDARNAADAISAFDQMALEADLIGFIEELARVLALPIRIAQQIVEDSGGEALACAVRAIGMPGESFQRVLLFLDPELGASVKRVYRLSRLYDTLSERVALIMLAAWRSEAQAVTRARHRPALHDEERHRARPATRSAVSSSAVPLSDAALRQGSHGRPNRD